MFKAWFFLVSIVGLWLFALVGKPILDTISDNGTFVTLLGAGVAPAWLVAFSKAYMWVIPAVLLVIILIIVFKKDELQNPFEQFQQQMQPRQARMPRQPKPVKQRKNKGTQPPYLMR
jgi:hypothetical protein